MSKLSIVFEDVGEDVLITLTGDTMVKKGQASTPAQLATLELFIKVLQDVNDEEQQDG